MFKSHTATALFSRLLFFTFAALQFLQPSANAAAPEKHPEKKPNIVIINTDDLGYGDVSCYGATKIQTPNVDRLAAGGLLFTDGYATSATCTPSRFSLLTGKYAWRKRGTNILPGDASLIIPPGSDTLPAVLQRAGYNTAAIGKWHLGMGDDTLDWNAKIAPGPLEIGFDYCYLIPATQDRVPCVYVENHRVVNLDPKDPLKVDYKTPFPDEPTGKKNPELLELKYTSHVADYADPEVNAGHKGKPDHSDAVINGIPRIGYMTGGKSAIWDDDEMAIHLTEQAVSFIEKHQKEPFFLYFATNNIHVPRIPNARFVGKSGMGARGDSILEMDWSVGQILDALDRTHLAENTIVIFTSDNGPVLDDGYDDKAFELLNGHRPGGPLRAGKYSASEAGSRVPFIIRWPAKIQPGKSSALVSQVDLLASLAALTGQTFNTKDAPDSMNMLAAFLGESKSGRDHIIEQGSLRGTVADQKRYRPALAVRVGDWKLVSAADENGKDHKGRKDQPPLLLFNLAEDPREQKNVAAQHPEKVKELQALLEKITTSGKEIGS